MQVSRACGVQVNSSGVVSARVLRPESQKGRGVSPSLRARDQCPSLLAWKRENSPSGPLFVLCRCSVDWMIATHMRRGRGGCWHMTGGVHTLTV